MEQSPAIARALTEVSPRLKRLRTQRGVTLAALAAATGISKSTLSRLESGQRRPSLELLLPIAQAYQVPLDEMVGAPEVGDPRIRLTPKRVHGNTVLPLTRQPGPLQAVKIIVPAGRNTLVRQPRRQSRRDPQHPRPPGRARARPRQAQSPHKPDH